MEWMKQKDGFSQSLYTCTLIPRPCLPKGGKGLLHCSILLGLSMIAYTTYNILKVRCKYATTSAVRCITVVALMLMCLYNNRCTAWRNVSAVLACIKPPGMQLGLPLSVRASAGNHHTYIDDMCPLLYVRPQF